jgi:hypothetical protein
MPMPLVPPRHPLLPACPPCRSSFQSSALSLAYIADLLGPHNRAATFGLTMACFRWVWLGAWVGG